MPANRSKPPSPRWPPRAGAGPAPPRPAAGVEPVQRAAAPGLVDVPRPARAQLRARAHALPRRRRGRHRALHRVQGGSGQGQRAGDLQPGREHRRALQDRRDVAAGAGRVGCRLERRLHAPARPRGLFASAEPRASTSFTTTLPAFVGPDLESFLIDHYVEISAVPIQGSGILARCSSASVRRCC